MEFTEEAHSSDIDTPPNLICGECISSTPSFNETLCAFKYEFPIKEIIHQIKYDNKRYWIKPLCQIFEEQINFAIKNRECFVLPDLLIPIPLHKSKLKIRGFNQAELIAKTISKQASIPFSKSILRKVKNTGTQSRLGKQDRMNNLNNSMEVSNKAIHKEILANKHIALIDDVMTTKATAEYASQLLRKAGARRIDIWCIARTPRQKTN